MSFYSQLAVGAIAVFVAFWPQLLAAARQAASWFKDSGTPVRPLDEVVAPSYRDAIYHLAQVRLRLRTTGVLDDARKQAIDALTLALVEGSDQ
jgi:hypothetical protein